MRITKNFMLLLAPLTACLLLLWILAPDTTAADQSPTPSEFDHLIHLPMVQGSIPEQGVVRIDGFDSFEAAIPLRDGGVLLHDNRMAARLDAKLRPLWAVEIAAESPLRFAAESSDGNLFAAGSLLRNNDRELIVSKLSPMGDLLWQHSLDTPYHDGDYPFGIAPATGGGVVIASRIQLGPADADGLLFRLNADGSLAWQKAVGGEGGQLFSAITPLDDGGFVAVGSTYQEGQPGGMWLVRFDDAGNTLWQRAYSGTECWASIVRVTADGDFIIAGNGYYGCVVRIAAGGGLLWSRVYEQYEGEIHDIRPVDGLGYLVAGTFLTTGPTVEERGWVALLEGNGNIDWQQTYDIYTHTVVRSAPGDFLVSGYGSDGLVSGDHLLRLSPTGTIVACDKVLVPGQATSVRKQAASTPVNRSTTTATADYHTLNLTSEKSSLTATWLCPQIPTTDPCQQPATNNDTQEPFATNHYYRRLPIPTISTNHVP